MVLALATIQLLGIGAVCVVAWRLGATEVER